ncbi:MAG: hypothetical protein R3E96_08530 [Planctomycetota bacterium]
MRDLTMGLMDFTGPRIDTIRLYDELDSDEDGGGPSAARWKPTA